ncbi:MAG: hypothetical protein JWM14_455 [Chitinophagaceae bacterium]|nr:hypothetical protein [Chitinophagaceae bacterium]
MEKEKFTAVIQELDSGHFIGHIEEVKGVITQATTLEEAKKTLVEALMAMIEVKTQLGEAIKDNKVTTEIFSLS